MLRSDRRSAMTLAESLVVALIVVVFVGSVLFYVINKSDQARVDRAKVDLQNLAGALERYHAAMGEYPTSEQGLDELWAPIKLSVADQTKWRAGGGPYVRMQNYDDPWGHPYAYICAGADEMNSDPSKHEYELLTYGADGRPGGNGRNRDISVWMLVRR